MLNEGTAIDAPQAIQVAVSTFTAAGADEKLVLARRLELAAGGIPIGITNRVGSGNDKHAHFTAMPGGPSAEHPYRPKGPGPNDRGAQYYATTDLEKIMEWSHLYPGCNTIIGGLLPDDVGCIDIDRADEFRALCPGMLERLQERGHPMDKRIGRDRWHIWFRMPEGRKARELPGRNCWGEIKWTGGLVVSSPSATYESVIRLVSWATVPRLTNDDIRAICGDSATSEFSAPSTASAGRHPEYLAISASMAARGCAEQQIFDEIMDVDRRSANPAYNDPSRPGDFAAEVQRMVAGAIAKFARSTYLDSEFRPAGYPHPRIAGRSLPRHLMSAAGLAGEIAAFIDSQALVNNPELAFWGGIVAVAHASGRLIVTETGLSPGIGVVLLARSASGKDKPQEVLGEIFARADLGSTIVRKIASGQGIEDRLEKDPKILLMVDEAMHLFREMADPKQGHVSAEPMLKELLSGKRYYTGRAAAKVQGRAQTPVSVYRPHLTFYGSAVPSEFFDTINTQMINGGLMGRLLCPIIPSGELAPRAPAWRAVPDSIIEQVRQWSAAAKDAGDLNSDSPFPRQVPFTEEARVQWNAYRQRCHPRGTDSRDEFGATLWARAAEKAMRLALIRAASHGGLEVPAINASDVLWACDVVDYYTTQMVEQAAGLISVNEVERKRNKFRDVMRKFLERHPGEGLVPHSHVIRYSKLSGRECQETANDLIDCQEIQIHQASPSSNGKRTTFYAFATPDSQIHAPVSGAAVNLEIAQNAGNDSSERAASVTPPIDSPIHTTNDQVHSGCTPSIPEVNL